MDTTLKSHNMVGASEKQAVQKPEIPAELDILEVEIQHLTDAVALLGERLHPVLRRQPPTSENPEDIVVPSNLQTHLGDELKICRNKISGIISVVDDLRDRCEL